MTIRYFTFIFSCIFISEIVTAQTISDLQYTSYTTADGLINNSISDIIQDNSGYLWIGTNGGLEKFDGYKFTHYTTLKSDSNSLSENRIVTLYIDSKERLWIGTKNEGINLYNPQIDGFRRYIHNNGNALLENQINDIIEDKQGNLIIATSGGGLNTFYPEAGIFEDIAFATDNDGKNSKFESINCIAPTDGTNYIIGSSSGLGVFNPKQKILTDYYLQPGDLKHFDNIVINSIAKDQYHNLWIGTAKNGLLKLSLSKVNQQNEIVFERIHINIVNEISKIIIGQNGKIIIGTFQGVIFYDPVSETYESSNYSYGKSRSINSNRIISLYEDDSNVLWFGSSGEGINKADTYQKGFKHYIESKEDSSTLSSNFVNDFLQNEDGRMWIASFGGLNLLDKKRETYESIIFSKENFFRNAILSLFPDDPNHIWVGTADGIVKLNTKNFSYSHISEILPKATEIHHLISRSILKDTNNNILWLGSWNNGLFEINLDNKAVKTIDIDTPERNNKIKNSPWKMIQDENNNVWIATNGFGIIKYDPSKGTVYKFDQIDQIPDLVIITIFQDELGEIWAGTSTGGLIKYNPASQDFSIIDKNDGLPGNEVRSIIDDHNGDLWLATNRGLSNIKFSPSRKDTALNNLDQYKITISNYTEEDGLQSSIFYESSCGKDSENNLYFGGNNGFNVFNPENISTNPHKSKLIFTDLQISNHSVKPGEQINGRIILQTTIDRTEQITLTHEEHLFSVEFAAIHFATPQKIIYEYQLVGFDDKWIETDASRRFVSYSNLKPGKYSLKVRSSNGDGLWNETPTELKILVKPPWWETYWFDLSVTIIIIGGIFGFIRLKTYNHRKKQQDLKIIIDKRTKEISEQNYEIQAQNEELLALNEEITAQSEQLHQRNNELNETKDKLLQVQNELKLFNINLEKQVKQRTARLEKVIKELDHFVYSASHDLGAPLKSVLGLISITKYELQNHKSHQNLEMMETSILNLENVIKSLKQYSRNSSLEVELSEFNLYDLIINTLQELKFIDSYYRIKINTNVPKSTLLISDFQRIRSVIINLFDNAIKYYDPEKETHYININYSERPDFWILEIEDNGIGIDNNQIDKIFNMFHRSTEKSNGSGLGLFIVKESLSKLNATIEVTSQIQVGTKFKITHPTNISAFET